MSREAEGFVVGSLVPGGPAEKGGLQAGDVVEQFGDAKVTDRQSLSQAIRRYADGDKVAVIVRRDGQQVTLHIVLQERR